MKIVENREEARLKWGECHVFQSPYAYIKFDWLPPYQGRPSVSAPIIDNRYIKLQKILMVWKKKRVS